MAAMPGSGPEPTLRGRGRELRTLRDAVDRAAAGQPALVTVEGEAGIGKSRLLAETARLAEAGGLQVFSGKAEEIDRDRPFGLIARALGCTREAADPRRASIAALLAGSDRPATVTVSSDAGLRFRVVDALCDLLEQLATDRPVLLGLDDLHCADSSTMLTLAAMARSSVGLPIALVGCSRPLPRTSPWQTMTAAFEAAGGRHLRPRLLEGADVRDLVAETVEGEPGPRLLAHVADAAGNPFFVIELVRALMQEGVVHTAAGEVDVATTSLPPTLRLTILQRLHPLSESALRALRTGALLGTSFSLTELAAVEGRAAPELVLDLEAAITAGVLIDDSPRLRFRHDLIRDAVYADIPTALRADLHRDAARRLAESHAAAGIVAEQFSQAAGTTVDDEAAEWLARAAHETVATAPGTAAGLLARAVGFTSPANPERDRLALEQADTLMLAGHVADAAGVCRALLAGPHDGDIETHARARLGAALLVGGWPEEALQQLNTVLETPATPERTSALGEAATAMLWVGDFDGAARAAEQAHPAALAAGDHRTATAALATLSVVACMRGQAARAIELSDRAVSLADSSPHRAGHGYPVHATRGWILTELDQGERARRALNTGLRLCEELGVHWPMATYQAYLAVERFGAGEWDDAVTEFEAGIGVAEENGVAYALKPSISAQALIRLHRNDLPGARDAVDRALAFGDRGSRLFDYRAAWAQALLLEADGQLDRAFTTLSGRWHLCQDAGMAVDYPVVGPDLVRLARVVGDRDLADKVTDAVEDVAARSDVPSVTGAALRCRGLLTDDPAAMRRAVDAYARGPRRLEWALTCEEAAASALRHGDVASGRSLLERAGAGFAMLGAGRGTVRVDAELRRLGVRRGTRGRRARPRTGWEALTPTERTVAGLVAEGLTNPQIADRLYVSRRTVQTHVSHIFAKLRIASRAQLAVRVARRPVGRGAVPPPTEPGPP